MKKGDQSKLVLANSLLMFLFSVSFVFAAHVITTSTGSSSFSVDEDVQNVFNVTVNNTDTVVAANISQVNITIPSSFSFASTSNDTSAGAHTFVSSSSVLSWSNDGLVMNGTAQYFWFNATAATPGSYNLTVTTVNTSGSYDSNISVTVNDTTAPLVDFTSQVDFGNYSGVISLTLNVTDTYSSIDNVYFNITNASGNQNATATATNTSASAWNASINTSQYPDGVYNITAYVNDSVGNANNSIVIFNLTFDNTKPVVSSFSCSPSSVSTGGTVTCSCSGTDTGSGVQTTSYTTNPSTSSSGTKSTTCTVTDYAGNSIQNSTEYTVTSSGSSGSGGSSKKRTEQKSNSWSTISAGSSKTMKDFNRDFGIKEIVIKVDEAASDAKLTVKKFLSKPSQVSDPSGSVYKYLEINAENLKDELEKATITIKVEKSWLTSKNLEKDQIAMSKFDESAKIWNQLETTHSSDDSTYHYYTVDVTSFSYFTISEKVAQQKDEKKDDDTTNKDAADKKPNADSNTNDSTNNSSGSNSWVWTVVVVLIIVAAGYGFYRKKQKKQKDKVLSS